MQQCAFCRSFLLVASTFGLLYALLVPPFQSPDETAHFYRTAHLASGHLMATQTPDKRLGGHLPKSLPKFYQPFANLRYDYDSRTNLAAFQSAWQLPLRPEETDFVDFPNVGYYAPFPYLFQATVLRAFLAFECRPMLLFYAGRLATLAVWLALTLAALRLMPFASGSLAWLALLPSSLFLHASLTGDAVTNGLCFWLLAAMLSLAFGEKNFADSSRWLKVGIFVSSAMIVLSKPVYFPLVLLAWFIPKKKFSVNPSNYFYFAGGLCLFNLALLGWWYHYAGGLFIPYDEYHPQFREGVQLNAGVQPHEQLNQVLLHPFLFLKNTLLSYFESAPATLAHYFGKFGWEKNYLPGWVIGLLALATAWVWLTDDEMKKMQSKHRIGLVAIALSMMLALALVLYMQWMPVGADRVLALSGRYFFPIFPLLFLSAGGLFVKLKNSWVELICKILLLFALVCGAWLAVARYYFL